MPLIAQNPTNRVILGCMTFGTHNAQGRQVKLRLMHG
jgi:hypothetical protein